MEKLNLVIFTDDKIETELCKNYWQLNEDFRFDTNVKSLAKIAELSQKQFLELVNDQCDAQSTEFFCQDCSIPFIFQTRNDFLEKKRRLDWHINNWICINCSSERERQEEQKRLDKINDYHQIIAQSYSSESPQIILEDLSLKDTVYLLSFIRLCANEDLSYAQPLGTTNFHESLSPQKSFDYDILRHLHKEGLIKAHPQSPVEAFSGENAETFYLDKVFWILPILPNSDHPKYLTAQLEEIFRLNTFPE